MKNQNLPPIGTPVYHYEHGWGKIERINGSNEQYPIQVKFRIKGEIFTNEGIVSISQKTPTLSLTEYDLIKGGFTPISEWNKPKVGDVGYFWDSEGTISLEYGILGSISVELFSFQIGDGGRFKNFSPTIPEWYTEKLNEIKKGLQ